jgi:hypothetical protein
MAALAVGKDHEIPNTDPHIVRLGYVPQSTQPDGCPTLALPVRLDRRCALGAERLEEQLKVVKMDTGGW